MNSAIKKVPWKAIESKIPVAFSSQRGRRFTIGKAERRPKRFPSDPCWSMNFPIYFEGVFAGFVFCSESYGIGSSGPRFHASTRGLFWSKASSAPIGIGYDVAAFDTIEECLKAWSRSADELLDWADARAS